MIYSQAWELLFTGHVHFVGAQLKCAAWFSGFLYIGIQRGGHKTLSRSIWSDLQVPCYCSYVPKFVASVAQISIEAAGLVAWVVPDAITRKVHASLTLLGSRHGCHHPLEMV